MVRGQGTEFDSLREYVLGDDVRSIDWRATARRADVVVRTWRPERDRRILIVLDTGRTSAGRVGTSPIPVPPGAAPRTSGPYDRDRRAIVPPVREPSRGGTASGAASAAGWPRLDCVDGRGPAARRPGDPGRRPGRPPRPRPARAGLDGRAARAPTR